MLSEVSITCVREAGQVLGQWQSKGGAFFLQNLLTASQQNAGTVLWRSQMGHVQEPIT